MNDLAKHLNLLGSKVKAQSEPFSGFVESIAFDKYGLISALVTSCDYKAGTTPDAKWFAVDDLTATSLHFSAGSIERFFVDWFSGNTHYPVCVCGSWQIYRAYSQWCVSAGEKPRSQNHLSGYLCKQPGWRMRMIALTETNELGEPKRLVRCFTPPDDEGLYKNGRCTFRKLVDQTYDKWATYCVSSFRKALEADE